MRSSHLRLNVFSGAGPILMSMPAEATIALRAPSERWGLAEGEEIAPGRHALKRLGGGHRYEAYLAWDVHLHSIVVAKVLRPHLTSDERALRDLIAEADLLARLDHRVLLRSFGFEPEGPSDAPGAGAPGGAAALDPGAPLRAASCGATRAPRGPDLRGPSLHVGGGLRAPGHEAVQHHDECAAAPDRPQHRPVRGRSGRAPDSSGDRRVHGPGAVPTCRAGPGRNGRGHLGPRRHAAPRRQGRAPVSRPGTGGERPRAALAPAHRGARAGGRAGSARRVRRADRVPQLGSGSNARAPSKSRRRWSRFWRGFRSRGCPGSSLGSSRWARRG